MKCVFVGILYHSMNFRLVPGQDRRILFGVTERRVLEPATNSKESVSANERAKPQQ